MINNRHSGKVGGFPCIQADDVIFQGKIEKVIHFEFVKIKQKRPN
jgi:hypothetical protein